jgi:hypothetical protein
MRQAIFHDSDILPDERHVWVARWMRFLSPTSFILVLFVFIVSWQTLMDDHPPPIGVGKSEATGLSGPLATLVTYNRSLVINNDVVAVVSRQLECKGHPTYDFPESTRKYEEGSRTASRSLVAPFPIADGTPCQLLSSYSYKPAFSFTWHHVKIPPISFVIQKVKGESNVPNP